MPPRLGTNTAQHSTQNTPPQRASTWHPSMTPQCRTQRSHKNWHPPIAAYAWQMAPKWHPASGQDTWHPAMASSNVTTPSAKIASHAPPPTLGTENPYNYFYLQHNFDVDVIRHPTSPPKHWKIFSWPRWSHAPTPRLKIQSHAARSDKSGDPLPR